MRALQERAVPLTSETDEHGQQIGLPAGDLPAPSWPSDEPLTGRFCRLEKLDAARRGDDLFAGMSQNDLNWTYLPYGPAEGAEDLKELYANLYDARDPHFYAVLDLSTGKATGVAAYLRIDPKNYSIEVGHIHFSPLLQRTPAATEAMYLMMRNAFALGYRRYEWKCNALNNGSKAAALRLGFSYEGTFRQATISKGRNRDTAWFSILDGEWPVQQTRFEMWLDPSNFDGDGRQVRALQDC